MHAHTRREHLLIRDARHALSGDRNVMTAASESVRKIKYVPLFTTNVRRKELSQKEKTH
jgi:hypothetical protein